VLRRLRLKQGENTPKSEDDEEVLLRNITLQIKKYQDLKAAGLKHLPTTYQLGGVEEKDPYIVMTDYTENDEKIVLSNNSVGNGVAIENIENFDEVLRGIQVDVQKASTAGFFIPLDAYFFIVPSSGGVVKDMSFAIADMDECMRPEEGSQLKNKLFALNLEQARGALLVVLINHMQDFALSNALHQKLNAWATALRPKV